MSSRLESARSPFVFSPWRTLISGGLISLLGASFLGWTWWQAQGLDQPRQRLTGEQRFAVETLPLFAEDRAQTLKVSGSIEADRQVDLRPLVAGQVVWVNENLRDGGTVAAEEPLLRLDPTNFALNAQQADITLAEAEDALARLNRDLDRQTRQLALSQEQLALAEGEQSRRRALFDQGLLAQAALEQGESQTLAQRQTVTNAENSLAQLEDQRVSVENSLQSAEIGRDLAAENLANTELRAPFEGLVLTSLVQEGQLVSQGDLAARLIDPRSLVVRIRVPRSDFAALSASGALIGTTAQVTWPGLRSEQSLRATVVRQGGTLDPSAGGVPMFLRLDATALETGLRPGAFVDVALQGRAFGQVFALPREAYYPDLTFGQGRNGGVYLVDQVMAEQGAQWRGPTSRRAVAAINAWLDTQVDLGSNTLVPAHLHEADAAVALGELYTCVPLTTLRVKSKETHSEQKADPALRVRLVRAFPHLWPQEQASLCPPVPMAVARATPARLIAFDGAQALVVPATGSEQDWAQARLVTTRFDKLGDGTWLTLPEEGRLDDGLNGDILDDVMEDQAQP